MLGVNSILRSPPPTPGGRPRSLPILQKSSGEASACLFDYYPSDVSAMGFSFCLRKKSPEYWKGVEMGVCGLWSSHRTEPKEERNEYMIALGWWPL